ncbi:unnamed protein product, partial [marine sediment metagenome]
DIDYKGKFNLVTNVDRQSQRKIIEIIRSSFPDHSILAEEKGGLKSKKSPYRWLIDPLDGTNNYAHGYPCFCVSIALEKNKEIILGVVYNPVLNELFFTKAGKGSFRNGEQIFTSQTKKINQSLLSTGFPYSRGKQLENHIKQFRVFMEHCHGIRRDGSAALNLCYIAMGRFDGFWEIDLSPWDTAAGCLLVKEAGGKLTNFSGHPFSHYGKEILATNGLIHKQMLKIIKNPK